ncbi:MAG: restriction endonuclease subunit R [Moorea sp. SIO4G2]|nr:restriction endonuclease subunit R [Moorena sp. SIO4G2]
MVETIQAKDVTLKQLKTLVNLQLVNDNQFFREWQDNLPEISELQQQLLDDVKAGYFNLLYYPPLLEKTVNLAILSPLLFIGKFYLEPFHIKAEKTVEISVDDHGIIVKGSIDTLVLHNEFWMTIIESKQASFSIEAGLPQLLAYMLANPHPDQPSYGMITTGGTFIFIKLVNGEKPRYATSAEFSLRNPGNDLYQVLRILKKLSQIDI